jgi:hypothetical protein
MPSRVQLKAKYGKALESEFARIFEALPKKGKGVALVEKETEMVLTFIAESEEEAKTMEKEAGAPLGCHGPLEGQFRYLLSPIPSTSGGDRG